MSISTLKIWFDGYDDLLEVHLCKHCPHPHAQRGLNGVITVLGKKVLLRLQKSNVHDRSHGCMNGNEKKDDHMVMIGWEQVLSQTGLE